MSQPRRRASTSRRARRRGFDGGGGVTEKAGEDDIGAEEWENGAEVEEER